LTFTSSSFAPGAPLRALAGSVRAFSHKIKQLLTKASD
jgi:hypothetical protein